MPSIDLDSMDTIVSIIQAINDRQSRIFIDQEFDRARHLATHKTRIAVLKCSDGRVHLPNMTGTPVGVLLPFRAIGGKFDLFWPGLIKRLANFVQETIEAGAMNAIFVTYHSSASRHDLGCAGWECDDVAAKAYAAEICQDLGYIYHGQMMPILLGIETDRDELIFHGNIDVHCCDLVGKSEGEIRTAMRDAYPEMSPVVLEDILPFVFGNVSHVRQFIEHPRELHERGHGERIVAVGQSFDWLAQANLALIINDMDANLDEAILKGASIVHHNLLSNAFSSQVALFTNIAFHQEGADRRQAEVRSRRLMRFALNHIRNHQPGLIESGRLCTITGITFDPTKRLTVLDTENFDGLPKS
jgi:hypothetical protein